MHKVFISYHHKNDQWYKEELLRINAAHQVFIDGSVDTGGVNDDLSDERIRNIIRDDYLQDTTVTVVLVGLETRQRKHIDWEIYSSMFDGSVNKKSGILVVNLPTTSCTMFTAAHSGEKEKLYPETNNWESINDRTEYEKRYPYLPDRLIDNLLNKNVKMSVASWDLIASDSEKLKFLIDGTFDDRANCDYDLSRAMRRQNS